MMKLLAIETATDICSIAYMKNGECVDLVEEKIPRQHAEKLPVFYDELHKISEFTLKEIDAIAVSIGPGSFTGLRIGLSYAKGLAFSQRKPLIPVPTLNSLTYGFGDQFDAVLLRSHGNKYFVQNNDKRDKIEVIELDNIIETVQNNSFKNIVHYGCEKLFSDQTKINGIEITPSAKLIGALAFQNYSKWVVQKPHKIIPNYVSAFNIGKRIKPLPNN